MVSGPSIPYDPTVRTSYGNERAFIQAWPSRGGLIVLEDAEAMDSEFLGFDRLDPPETRLDDQDAEDKFCKRLLLLGAKWWDSEERYSYVTGVMARGYSIGWGDGSFRNVTRPSPTMREKRSVKVGWPSTGGLWGSEFDTPYPAPDEEDHLLPSDGLARVKMAKTMDERCQVLRDRFRGKFYKDVSDYEGYAFLRAWEWKFTGEAGLRLLTSDETVQEWSESRFGHQI